MPKKQRVIKYAKASHVHYIHRHVDNQLDVFEQYVWTVDSALKREKDADHAHIEEVLAKMPEERHSDYLSDTVPEMQYLQETIPLMFWNAAFLSMYFFLEHQLVNLCRHYQKDRKLQIGPEDLKDQGIQAARKYLEKVLLLPFPADTTWNELMHYNRVRNVFVHNGGKVSTKEEPTTLGKSVRGYAATKKKIMSISDSNEVVLSRQFCLEALETVREFVKKLFDGLG
jgi:hypothetical protein